MIACEAANDHVFAHFRDSLGENILDSLGGVDDVFLFHEADGFVPFIEFAFNDAFGSSGRFAFCLSGGDFFFFCDEVGRDVLAFYVKRRRSGDVLAEVFCELFEFVVFGNEVGFAVKFDHDADAATHMDVALDSAFGSFSIGFFSSGSHAFFLKDGEGFFGIAIGFDECFFAIDKADACAFTEVVDHLSSDFLLWHNLLKLDIIRFL